MSKPYSLDLRKRVVAAIEGGLSRREVCLPETHPKADGGGRRQQDCCGYRKLDSLENQ
jgi:hypothetical protein